MNKLPDSLKQVEAMVAAAKNYIVPGDNLRPRVMEAARTRHGIKLNALRIFQFAAIMTLCVLVTIPAQQRMKVWGKSAFSPSTDEMQLQAQKYEDQPTVGQNWGMVEVYKNLKQQQSVKITSGMTNIGAPR